MPEPKSESPWRERCAPCAASCAHLPSPPLKRAPDQTTYNAQRTLEDFDVYVPPRPFFQVREEIGERIQGAMEIVVECRVARQLPQRPLPLVRLIEQAVQRRRGVRELVR